MAQAQHNRERGYYHTPEWRRKQREQLAREPWCECGELATTADHIVRRKAGGSDDDDNLQSMCGHCHQVKRARESRDSKISVLS